MPDLTFRILRARTASESAVPEVRLEVEVDGAPPAADVQSILLRCQVQLEPASRTYDDAERSRLKELFGDASSWARGLRRLLWTQQTVVVPKFRQRTEFEIPLPCSTDLCCAISKYLDALTDGTVGVHVFFSGTVFISTTSGLQAHPIPWDREAALALPAPLWRRAIDEVFPETSIVALPRHLARRLHDARFELGAVDLDDALGRLLERARLEKAP